MPTIDLTSPPPPTATGLLDTLPRRVTLTLPELRLVAEHAGGAPLPFEMTQALDSNDLDSRLGEGRGSAEDTAYVDALATLHDPATTLERRGLLGPGIDSDGLVGAVGLLATPSTAVDVDVTAGDIRARAWHRHYDGAVATLSTVDGIVFELAWFPTAQWATELGRAAALPEDLQLRASKVPDHVEIPFALADAAAEAMSSNRADLIPVLATQHPGTADEVGSALSEVAVGSILSALSTESRGRIRVLVADVSGDETTVVGVVSWTLLADGWHSLRPRSAAGRNVVVVRAVEPGDLARQLAPVLAEVSR